MKRQLTLMVFILLSNMIFCQTIGGNFRILNVSGITVRAELTVYCLTDNHTTPIINWGDNTSDSLVFENQMEVFDYTVLRYAKNHSFAESGVYGIKVNCNDYLIELNNVQNSFQKSLQFEMPYIISADLINTPAFIQNTALNLAYTDSLYTYNPNTYDADGDSLAYELIACVDSTYTYPVASTSFECNGETGVINWNKPITTGHNIIAYLIKEFRSGIQINSVVRVITINVSQNAGVTNQASIDKKTMIFPNPFTTEIFVESTDKIKSVEIYNMLGVLINKIECSPMFNLRIETSDFKKGAYFVKVIDEFGSFETYKLTR
jgi:hypothetical protein